jgi:hypothetical protein
LPVLTKRNVTVPERLAVAKLADCQTSLDELE